MGDGAPGEPGGVGTGSPMVSNGNQRKPMTLLMIACRKPPTAPPGAPSRMHGAPFYSAREHFPFFGNQGVRQTP